MSRILAKIYKRQRGDESAYQEMELFDQDRNPIELPPPSSVAAAASIPSRYGQIPNPSDTTVPPWNPFPWSYRIGLPIYDALERLVTAPTVNTDPAVKLVQSGSYLIQMRANMTLDWVGESGAFTYLVYPRLWVFKYDPAGVNVPLLTLGMASATIPFDSAAGGQPVVLQTHWQHDLDAGDELGAELRLDAITGPPAGGNPWFYPEGGDESATRPIVASLTRLGDYSSDTIGT